MVIALSKKEETALDDIMVYNNTRLVSLSKEERKRVVQCLEELTLLKLGVLRRGKRA